MTRFVGTPLRGIEFSSPSDEAISARVVSDAHPRIKIDAGGRLTWSSGSAAGDVNLYRYDINVLKTDDAFEAVGGVTTLTTAGAPTVASPDGTIAVDTTNDVFYYRSGSEWLQVSSGASVVISSTEPVGAESGDLWFDSDTEVLYILNGATWVSVSGSLTLSELDDVSIAALEVGHVLKYDGTNWVNDLVDSAYTAHTEVIGDGSTKNIVITHNFGTRDIVVQCRNTASPYESVEVGWEATSLNTVTLKFAVAPSAGSIRANIYAGIGAQGTNAYSENVGNGADTSFVLTHNFNTRDVVVSARNVASPYEVVEINWQATTVNTVTALFSVPPASSAVRVTVYAGGGVAGVTSIVGTANEIEVSGSTGTVQVGLPSNVALSGVPTAPTATYGTDTTQIATTEFVQDAVGGFATDLDGLSDVVITSPANGQLLQYDGTEWVNATAPTGEPMGHQDKTESTISFNVGTRTFSIAPVGASFTVWCGGVRYIKTTTETVVLPDTTGTYYIYYNTSGVLSAKNTYFDFSIDTPTAYVYWNATTDAAPYFADERHGIVLDWQTHEYLHRTRGAAIASGFNIAYAMPPNQNGAEDYDDALQIGISNGVFFDEDMEVSVTHSATPTANTWQQVLDTPANIPLFYMAGGTYTTGEWVRDTPNSYIVKPSGGVAIYNHFQEGGWVNSTIDNSKFGITWVVATNNLTYPVIGVIGQQQYAVIGDAQAADWSNLMLTTFPSVEFRPLFKVIFQVKTTGTNVAKAYIVESTDLRRVQSMGSTIPSTPVADHGSMVGLADDDHLQYLTEARHDAHDHSTAMGSVVLDDISNVSAASPSTGEYLKFNGTNWANSTISLGTDTTGNYVSDVTAGSGIVVTHTPGEGSSPTVALDIVSRTDGTAGPKTQYIHEITTNSYGQVTEVNKSDLSISLGTQTTGDYVASLVAGTGVSLANNSGENATPTISIGQAVGTLDSPSFAGLTIGGVAAATESYVTTAIANLVDSAPAALDTLNELAAALGDDANFATTVTNALADKAPLASPALTGTPTAPTAAADTNTTQIATTAFVQQEISGAILNDLSDVSILAPQSLGEVLRWSGGGWVNSYITLGLDTNGNYVSDVAAGTGISVSHTVGEGSTPTVSLDAALNALTDVDTTGATTGEFLKYDGSNWVPDSIPTINALDDIGDVTITAPSNGQVLKYNGTAWINDTDSTGTTINAIDDIGDVTITSPSNGQVLKYNGTAWVNDTDSAGTVITSLDDIGDVNITSIQIGETIKWDGTEWVNDLEAGYNNAHAEIIGDGTTTLFVLTHNFGTRDIFVQCRNNASPYENINVRWEATTEDTVTLDFSVAPSSNAVRVNIYASVGVVGPSAYSQTIGDGTNVDYAITHNMQTRDVVVSARNTASPYEVVDINWEATNTNTITARFSTPPSSNSIRVSVYAAAGVAGVTSLQGTANEIEVSGSTGGVTVGLPTNVTVAGSLTSTTLFVDSIEVDTTGATNGQFLGFNGTKFLPTAIPTINTLDDVGDVTITSIASGQYLQWDGSVWVNDTISVTDIDGFFVSAPITGQFLQFDGTDFANVTLNLDTLADVTITSPNSYDHLYWNGSAWVNSQTITINAVPTIGAIPISLPTTLDNEGITTYPWIMVPSGYTGTGIETNLVRTAGSQLVVGGQYVYFHPTMDRNTMVPFGLLNVGIASPGYYLTDYWNPSGTVVSYLPRSGGINTTHVGAMSLGLTYRQAGTNLLTNSNFYIAFTDNSDSINGAVSMFVPSDLTIDNPSGTVTITGNLTVSGTTTTLNTTELLVEDNIITLNSGETGSPSLNAGIEVERGTSTNVQIRWNESTDKWQFTNDGTTYKDLGSGGVTVSDTVPSSPATGDMWYESDTGSLFAYYDSAWVEIGPGAVYDQIIGSIQAKGDLLVGTASQTIGRVAVGSNGARLTADSSTSTGVAWVSDSTNTVIDAKGDLLVGSAADTLTRLAAGSNGQYLVSDSNQASGLGWVSQNTRNLFYNGAMQVHQRGTSTASITTANYYTADRWQTDITSLGTWTQSVENDAPTGSGFRKSLKMLCTSANASPSATTFCTIQQRLEGQDIQALKKGTSSAEQATVSFWVKSNVTGNYVFELYDNDNARQVSKSYTVSASGVWEFKTLTLPADTVGLLDNDNALSLYAIWWLAAGSTFSGGSLNTSWAAQTAANRAAGQTNLASATNNYWQITGVQLNVGPVAAPFEFKSYGRELAECQRYYYSANIASMPMGPNTVYSSGSIWVPYPVNMRATPASSASGTAFKVGDGSATSISVGTGTYGDEKAFRCEFSGGAWARMYTGTLVASAEL